MGFVLDLIHKIASPLKEPILPNYRKFQYYRLSLILSKFNHIKVDLS